MRWLFIDPLEKESLAKESKEKRRSTRQPRRKSKLSLNWVKFYDNKGLKSSRGALGIY